MAKVFTITEGLENMGALRTGGQGSVYKARRMGPIISAVKLLPTPIHTEDKEDKNFKDFQNEVEKLKKVNEEHCPNVVKILNSGLTESGSFPFIEMEYIEGPDLEELLKEPHEPIFPIREVIKLADQLSNALAHCHKVNVKHGDIKSNNVKFNLDTGNYILLDFGLAVMSDEQRRSSLRHAGAIEFMAPEQHDGEMLFETDVYSFGVILYELLTGSVPFPLVNKSENSRNTVMLSHMETEIPDLVQLRRSRLPANWSDEKKEREMQIPAWLLDLIARCLQKNPKNRYENGVALHEAIIQNSTLNLQNKQEAVESVGLLQNENSRLRNEVIQQQEEVTAYDSGDSTSVSISKPLFIFMLILIGGLSISCGYLLFTKGSNKTDTNTKAITPVTDSANKAATDTSRPVVHYVVPSRTEPGQTDTIKQDQPKDTVPKQKQPASEPNTPQDTSGKGNSPSGE